MADITTHLERLSKTAMNLEIPVLLEAKEEILRLRQSWHWHRDEIERLRAALHKVLGIVGNFPVDRFEYNIIKEARTALGEKE